MHAFEMNKNPFPFASSNHKTIQCRRHRRVGEVVVGVVVEGVAQGVARAEPLSEAETTVKALTSCRL
jgi:hypothetical protein